MPHGCSLSLHETSGNKMHMPHELTPKWIGLKCPDTFISTAQRVCETCSKVAGGVGQMSALVKRNQWPGRSVDFHPSIFNCFHELYPLTFIIYSLEAFVACQLFLVYIWVLSGSINLSEYCQLLPI